MFIAALFVIIKAWKQLRYPSADGRIDEAWLSVQWSVIHEQEGDPAICSNMDEILGR